MGHPWKGGVAERRRKWHSDAFWHLSALVPVPVSTEPFLGTLPQSAKVDCIEGVRDGIVFVLEACEWAW